MGYNICSKCYTNFMSNGSYNKLCNKCFDERIEYYESLTWWRRCIYCFYI